jgi:hypothetical protein
LVLIKMVHILQRLNLKWNVSAFCSGKGETADLALLHPGF